MDRADFQLVITLARAGSLTAAARELHVAQPALGRRLAHLEREVGAELFRRGRHGATPTIAGRTLVEGAVVALAAIDRAEQDAADVAAGRAGRLRIGVIPTLGAVLLPPVLAGFRRAHPGVRIELFASGDSADLRARVADGALDVAVASLGTTDEPGVRIAAHGEQRFVVVAPVDTELPLKGGRVERARLIGLPVVALASEGLRSQLDDVFASLGATPDISIETSEREMLIPLVAAGLGITLVPEGFVRQRSVEGLAIYELTPAVTRSIGALVPSGDVPATVAAFVAMLAEHGELKLTRNAARRSRS